MKTKKVFSINMAVYLRERGCRIIRTEVNRYRPEYDVWIFEDTDELHKALDEYMHHHKTKYKR